MRKILDAFWRWYERHYLLNITIASILFFLQLLHLYWLTVDVVLLRLTNITGLWPQWDWLAIAIVLVDYAEIPALITTSVVYINEIRQGRLWKPLLFLILLNSQWLHIFWITDEFVLDVFFDHGQGTVLPGWLAWVAIAIDYLELPIIIDLFIKLGRATKEGRFVETYQKEILEK
jgi:hypothetical protein